MSHDPLCPVTKHARTHDDWSYYCANNPACDDIACRCEEIAEIRADEREQAIRDCIAAVDGLSPWRKTDPDEVENALRGLREKP